MCLTCVQTSATTVSSGVTPAFPLFIDLLIRCFNGVVESGVNFSLQANRQQLRAKNVPPAHRARTGQWQKPRVAESGKSLRAEQWSRIRGNPDPNPAAKLRLKDGEVVREPEIIELPQITPVFVVVAVCFALFCFVFWRMSSPVLFIFRILPLYHCYQSYIWKLVL